MISSIRTILFANYQFVALLQQVGPWPKGTILAVCSVDSDLFHGLHAKQACGHGVG